LLLEVFTQQNFVADFILLKLTFIQKTKKRLSHLSEGDLEVTYALVLSTLTTTITETFVNEN